MNEWTATVYTMPATCVHGRVLHLRFTTPLTHAQVVTVLQVAGQMVEAGVVQEKVYEWPEIGDGDWKGKSGGEKVTVDV